MELKGVARKIKGMVLCALSKSAVPCGEDRLK